MLPCHLCSDGCLSLQSPTLPQKLEQGAHSPKSVGKVRKEDCSKAALEGKPEWDGLWIAPTRAPQHAETCSTGDGEGIGPWLSLLQARWYIQPSGKAPGARVPAIQPE